MRTSRISGRTFYRSDGGAHWLRFLSLALLPLLVSAVTAVCLFIAYLNELYFVIVLPVLAFLPVLAILYLAITFGHCRNRIVAGSLGALVALIMYVGSYYVGMVYYFGIEYASRIDLLPGYINSRMHSDKIDRSSSPHGSDRDEDKPPGAFRIGLYWLLFALELGIVLALGIFICVIRAGRAYCTTCRQWMTQLVATFPPGTGYAHFATVNVKTLSVVALLRQLTGFENNPYTAVAIEYCPTTVGHIRSCPIYLTVKEVRKGGGGPTKLQQCDAAFGKTILRRAQLTRDEVRALEPLFPELVGKKQISRSSRIVDIPLSHEAQKVRFPAMAYMEPLPEKYTGKVLTPKTTMIVTLLTLLVGSLSLIGILVALFGAFIAFPQGEGWNNVSLANKIIGIALLSFGILLAGVFMVVGLSNPGFIANRYLRKRIRTVCALRPHCMVNPAHPEALFVEIVPRRNWLRQMFEHAADIGFFYVDGLRQEIFFEGDKERYQIPGDAVFSCEVERVAANSLRYFFLVLKVRHITGEREIAVRPREGSGPLGVGKRAHRMYQIKEKIRAIMPKKPDKEYVT